MHGIRTSLLLTNYITAWLTLTALSSTFFTTPNLIGSSFGVPGNASYDYVILGGGTAGVTLATRLAQNGSHTVALVEAGGFYEFGNGNFSTVPALATHFTGSDPDDVNPAVDWAFVTTPQAGLGNRRLHYARGKCLGGSSARNYFLYQRGTRGSYDRWASQVNDASYTFDSLLPYFKRSVDFTQANNDLRFSNASYTFNKSDSVFSRRGGPLQVTLSNYADAFATWLLKAFPSIGVPTATDFVSGELKGAQWGMVTLDPESMTRSSSQTSFLRKAVESTGLIVYPNSMVERIMFDGKTATGAVINTFGLQYSLMANKEVIVSMGTFQSPQILMTSGIGPAATLSKFGIDVISDLPGVGQNLWQRSLAVAYRSFFVDFSQDHIFFGIDYRLNLITHSALGDPEYNNDAIAAYHANATGVYTTAGGDIIGFEKLPPAYRQNFSKNAISTLASLPSDWPEIEFLMLDGYAGDNSNYISGSPKTPYNYGSLVAALVAPFSRGNVTIGSASMSDLPIVNPNWFTDPVDREVGVAAFRRLRELMGTPTMQQVVIGDEVYPGNNYTTDVEILQAIEKQAITVYHAAGTAKMGNCNDSMAVLDSKARVYGVERLRVVDASAFPFLPPGHPMSTIYALAEKIAQDILDG